MTSRGTIYDLLAQIQERPSMFLEDHSLEQLEMLLRGYEACLWSNDIEEEVVGRPFHTASFGDWLEEEKGWAADCGFFHPIAHEAGDAEASFDLFFALLAKYRGS